MAERTETDTARTNNSRIRRESQNRSSLASGRSFNDDDVIASLANAPENRRARQVNEWERVGMRSMFRVV